ncbi:MAG: AraC family transcriptional regulator [Blautia sp.]|nr:AraC family transcriptional regulator [Blautia sp.]
MDEYVFLRTTEHRFQDLYLCFCGYEECSPLHGWGPCIRPSYLIHYVLSGKGIYRVGNKTWKLKAGDGFLIEPEVLTFYQADAQDPWTYIWISFDGSGAKTLLGNLGLKGENLTFHCERRAQLKQVVLTMLGNSVFSLANDYLLQSQLYLFFAILLMDIEVEAQEKATGHRAGSDYVRIAQDYIRNNYSRPEVKVTDIAAYAGVNRSYLYTIFKKELGLSPQEYLTAFRLSRAEELLNNTDLPIETIAFSSGYADPVVFGKAFKRYKGLTPNQQRKNWHERTQGMLQDEEGLKNLSEEGGK